MKFFDYSELNGYKSKRTQDGASLTFYVDSLECVTHIVYRKNKKLHGFLFDWCNHFGFNKNERNLRHYIWKDKVLQ